MLNARPLLLPLLACLWLPAYALENPSFDENLSGWRLALASGGGGLISWDGTRGDPDPGSARIGNIFLGDRKDGLRQCVPLSGGDWYQLRAQVLPQLLPGNFCELRLFLVNDAICQGATVLFEAAASTSDGSWQTLRLTMASPPPGHQAVALELSHNRVQGAAAGDSYCNFDTVSLVDDHLFAAGFE